MAFLATSGTVVGCAKDNGNIYRFEAKTPVAARPAEAQRVYETAINQILEKNYAAAQSNLETAVRFDPEHGRAFNNLGWLYYRAGQYYRAAHAFHVATRLLPEHPSPVSNLGLTMAAAGLWEDAVDFQTRAAALDPDNPKYQTRLAYAQVKRGDEIASLRSLLQVVLSTTTRDDWARWAQDLLASLELPKPIDPNEM